MNIVSSIVSPGNDLQSENDVFCLATLRINGWIAQSFLRF